MKPRTCPAWVVWALLARLFLMPTHYHPDLLFIHYFPYFLSHQGVWDIYGYFKDHYLSQGFTYYQPVVYYTMALFQWLIGALSPQFDGMMQGVHRLFYAYTPVPAAFWNDYSLAQRMGLIFWMKAPYLIMDLAICYLILRMQKNSALPPNTAQKWAFHPVLLFATYMFGQYRILGAFFSWSMLYLASDGKKKAAFAVFGLLCLTDCYPALLIVPALMCYGRGIKERAQLLLCAMAPVAAILGPLVLHSGPYSLYSYFSPLVFEVSLKSVTLQQAAWVGPLSKIVLLAGYVGILIRLRATRVYEATLQDQSLFFVRASAAALLLLYATTGMSLHYFMWVLPFWVILAAQRQWPKTLSFAVILLLFIFNLNTRLLNAGLWVPLDPDRFISLPSIQEWMEPYLPWGKVVGASRALFSILCLYVVFKIADVSKRRGVA